MIKIALVFSLALSAIGCSSELTAETSGQVTRVAIDRDRKVSRKTSSNKKRKVKTSVETEIDYRYSVNGRSYDGYSEKDGDVQRDFASGAQVVVCYNPNDPAESEVYSAGTKCG